MKTVFVIYKGNFPSLTHTRYEDESLVKIEVDRLEAFRLSHNEQVTNNPATGRGSAFLNMLWTETYSYRAIQVPED